MVAARLKTRMITKNNKTNSIFLFLFIAIVICLGVLIPSGAIYADALDEMVPNDGRDDAIYNKYGPSHYQFQTVQKDRKFWEVGAKAKDGIVSAFDQANSVIFLGSVYLTKFFTFICREALTFSFMDDFIDAIGEIIKNLTGINSFGFQSGGLWDSLGGTFLSITIAYILYLLVRARFLDGFQQIMSFVLALVLCLLFFSQVTTVLKTINDGTTWFGDRVYVLLAKSTNLQTDSTDGTVVISEQVWRELVIRPYSMLQFDDSEAYTKNPELLDKVLKTKPFTDEREAALKEAANTYPGISQVRSSEQILIGIVNLIFALIILGFLTFWALATLYMRFKFLVHAAIMSITLLGSLLPGRQAGLSVIRGQFIKLIGLAAVTTFTIIFLNLSIVMGHFAFKVVEPKGGWFLAMIIEALAIFVIFKYRNEISSVFSKATGVVPAMPRAKSTVVDAVQRNVTRTLYNGTINKVGGMFNRKEREGVPSTFNPRALQQSNNSVNDATTSSMMLRYHDEKKASEDLAAETGESVQYTPYVQKVNDNLRNGTKNPFRGMDKEWKEEKTRLEAIKKDGGDMKQAVLTRGIHDGMTDQEVAATLYTNENAIRHTSSFMVNRPKRMVDQMARAKVLNRDRNLQTSVNDFCMVQLFERYKVEHRQAIETSRTTGKPVKHTDFVKNMDSNFKEAGLGTTQKINDIMLKRSGRVSVATHFEGMKEFNDTKMKLLRANEAFRKATVPSGMSIPAEQVKVVAPMNVSTLLKTTEQPVSGMNERRQALAPRPQMDLKNVTATQIDSKHKLTARPQLETKVDMAKVNFNNPDLKRKMDEAKGNLSKTMSMDGLRLEVDTVAKTQVAVNLKTKISTEVSKGLQDEMNHLKTMNKARQVATVSSAADNISQQVQLKAKTARTKGKNTNKSS